MKLVTRTVFVLVLALVAFASKAEASLQVLLQEDNGAWTQATGNGGSPYPNFSVQTFGNSTFNDFNLQSANVTADNGTLSDLLSSALRITNSGSATHTLRILITETDFNLPSGSPLKVESGMAGTVNVGTVGLTGIFQAYANANNALPTTTNPLSVLNDFTNGPQTASLNGTTLDTGSATGLFSRGGLYSVSSLTTLTMNPGSQFNFATHVNLTPTVPEPASLTLLGTGLLFVANKFRKFRKGVK